MRTTSLIVLTISGLTVIPLTPNGAPTPVVTTGARGIVNAADGIAEHQARNLHQYQRHQPGVDFGSQRRCPAPTVLGGSCVTFNDVPLPLLKTAGNQIVAQVPTNIVSGTNVVVVHSLDTAQASTPVMVTVQPAGAATSGAGDTGTGDGTTRHRQTAGQSDSALAGLSGCPQSWAWEGLCLAVFLGSDRLAALCSPGHRAFG